MLFKFLLPRTMINRVTGSIVIASSNTYNSLLDWNLMIRSNIRIYIDVLQCYTSLITNTSILISYKVLSASQYCHCVFSISYSKYSNVCSPKDANNSCGHNCILKQVGKSNCVTNGCSDSSTHDGMNDSRILSRIVRVTIGI